MKKDIRDNIFAGTTWCTYCKEPILKGQNIVVKNDKVYHLDCWNLINNNIEELDFPSNTLSENEDIDE